jgi:hypothetical protein
MLAKRGGYAVQRRYRLDGRHPTAKASRVRRARAGARQRLVPHGMTAPSRPPTDAAALFASGVTFTGRNGYETAQRILSDIAGRAFANDPRFLMGATSFAVLSRWAWRLEVTPVP